MVAVRNDVIGLEVGHLRKKEYGGRKMCCDWIGLLEKGYSCLIGPEVARMAD